MIDIDARSIFLILALALFAAEMLTGAFIFMAVSAGFASGAVALWISPNQLGQASIATVGVATWAVAVALWLRYRKGTKDSGHIAPLGLDIGEKVIAQGARGANFDAAYRGTNWQAMTADGSTAVDGETYEIEAIEGSILIVKKN